MIAPRRLLIAGFAAVSLLSSVAASFAQPAPVPALPDTERRTSYSISASTCSCGVGFALFGDSTDFSNWLEVFINGTRVNYNDATFGWTITSPSGSLANLARPITDGVLTFTNAQTGTVQIVGARRPRRTSQFQENNGVPTSNFNVVLSDIIAMLREIWDKINDVTGRGLFFPPGNTSGPLPNPTACKNAYLGFDGTGSNPLCVSGSNALSSTIAGWKVSGLNADNACYGAGTFPCPNQSGLTFTVANGSPAIFTALNSGLSVGDYFIPYSTGTSPTGLTQGNVYYVVATDLSSFEVSASIGGSAVSTSGSSSGTLFAAVISNAKMTVNADYITTYSPTTGIAEKLIMAPSGQSCAINVAGPGGYDGTGPFAAGTVAILYEIWGVGNGANCIWSTNPPAAGPALPAGYTSYAPLFPLKFFGSVTLLPIDTSSGYTSYQVRGNRVNLPGRPLFAGVGFPGSSHNYSAWVPNAYALETSFIMDAELQGGPSSPTCCIAGALMSFVPNPVTTPGSQIFANLSCYPTPSFPYTCVGEYSATLSLQYAPTPQEIYMYFDVSEGSPSNSNEDTFLIGYTFSNGN